MCVSCSVMSDPCNPKDFSPPYSSDHGIFQVRILEWVPIPFSSYFGYPTENSFLLCFSKFIFIIGFLGFIYKVKFFDQFFKEFFPKHNCEGRKMFLWSPLLRLGQWQLHTACYTAMPASNVHGGHWSFIMVLFPAEHACN